MPSQPKFDPAVKVAVSIALRAGVKGTAIAKAQGVSNAYISKVRRDLRYQDIETNDIAPVKGRPKSIHHAAMEGLRDFMLDWPTARLDECCDFLRDEFGINAHISTVSRALNSMNVTYKRVTRVNTRRDDELVASYIAQMANYTSNQLVTLDESAANNRTMDRKFGWSARNTPCRVQLPGGRSTSWSILPAMTTDGWLTYEVYQGSFNAERFETFLQGVLDKMNPFPGDHSVLIMDNATIHRSDRVKRMCEEQGVILEYLPPYTPELNPIEMSFHELKEWMRKNRELGYCYENSFDTFIHLAMTSVCEAETAHNYFRRCGYI